MIVYEATKQSFLDDVYNDKISKKIKERLGFNVGSSENESWIDTANHMEKILRDNIFPNDISVAMEFKLYNDINICRSTYCLNCIFILWKKLFFRILFHFSYAINY